MTIKRMLLVAGIVLLSRTSLAGVTATNLASKQKSAPQITTQIPLSAVTSSGPRHAMHPSPTRDLTLIKHEDFEDAWPNDWTIVVNSGYADCAWGDVDCFAYQGNWSGWCANDGYEAPGPCSSYVNNMSAWMIYGPFDLSDAAGGYFDFQYVLDAETPYDYLFYGVSIDGSNFSGYSIDVYSPWWTYASLDFTAAPDLGNICGSYQVWIGFMYSSDASTVSGEGAYLDEISIYKDVPYGYVEIAMNSHFFYPNDWCTAFVGFDYPFAINDVPLFAILDVWGFYYFAPSFSNFDYFYVSPNPSWYEFEVIPGFYWPYGTGYASGLVWYAAMTDPTVTYLLSNISTWEFGYGD